MMIDGRKIAEEIFSETKKMVEEFRGAPRLTVFTSEPNFETQKFLTVKKKKADTLGVQVNIVELSPELDTAACVTSIKKAAETSDGIIVQLPFPAHIDREALIAAIPKTHDVDAFNVEDEKILPPVVGAIAEIVKRHDIMLENAKSVVLGEGKLVGIPVAKWMEKSGAVVTRLSKESGDISTHTKAADIIVLGVGVPGLLKPAMVKDGVVIFDAGTSEAEGKLAGDADPACAEKASIFTPVPGGIGPITVAVLLRNLALLAGKR